MSSQETLEHVRQALMDVLDIRELDINESTQARDVKGWDSMTHVRLIMTIERRLKIRFKNSEIEDLTNVGALVHLIDAKVG
jgi:acyl carrier protein